MFLWVFDRFCSSSCIALHSLFIETEFITWRNLKLRTINAISNHITRESNTYVFIVWSSYVPSWGVRWRCSNAAVPSQHLSRLRVALPSAPTSCAPLPLNLPPPGVGWWSGGVVGRRETGCGLPASTCSRRSTRAFQTLCSTSPSNFDSNRSFRCPRLPLFPVY